MLTYVQYTVMYIRTRLGLIWIFSEIDDRGFGHGPSPVCWRYSLSSLYSVHINPFSFYFFYCAVCYAKSIYLVSDVFPNLLFLLICHSVGKLTVNDFNIFSTSSVKSWMSYVSKFFPLFLTLLPLISSFILFPCLFRQWI